MQHAVSHSVLTPLQAGPRPHISPLVFIFTVILIIIIITNKTLAEKNQQCDHVTVSHIMTIIIQLAGWLEQLSNSWKSRWYFKSWEYMYMLILLALRSCIHACWHHFKSKHTLHSSINCCVRLFLSLQMSHVWNMYFHILPDDMYKSVNLISKKWTGECCHVKPYKP